MHERKEFEWCHSVAITGPQMHSLRISQFKPLHPHMSIPINIVILKRVYIYTCTFFFYISPHTHDVCCISYYALHYRSRFHVRWRHFIFWMLNLLYRYCQTTWTLQTPLWEIKSALPHRTAKKKTQFRPDV